MKFIQKEMVLKKFKVDGIIASDGLVGSEKTINLNYFENLLNAVKDDVLINFSTMGGEVFEAIKIFNFLKTWQSENNKKISFFVNGLVASAGTYIAMAGDKIYASKNSVFMIHSAHVAIYGNHNDFLDLSERLKKTNGILSDEYSNKSGKSVDEIVSLLEKDTYFYGKEIFDFGFADEFVDSASREIFVDDYKNFDGDVAKIFAQGVFASSMQKHFKNNNLIENKESFKMSNEIETIDEFKEKYPKLYAEAFNLGKDEAFDLVDSHLTWLGDGVPNKAVVENIKNRAPFGSKAHSEYSKYVLKNSAVNDLKNDLQETKITNVANDSEIVASQKNDAFDTLMGGF